MKDNYYVVTIVRHETYYVAGQFSEQEAINQCAKNMHYIDKKYIIENNTESISKKEWKEAQNIK